MIAGFLSVGYSGYFLRIVTIVYHPGRTFHDVTVTGKYGLKLGLAQLIY
jgi:hypothetical protein